MGKEATEYAKSVTKPGDIMKIEFDVQKRDQYKRILGYVYLSDGRMLNEEIIRAGYASPMTYPAECKIPGKIFESLQGSERKG
jgi:micrococcal nuclease